MSSSSKYRPDIDGLRALAILPVLLFHGGMPGFSGGFTGVDVFFVISGYLITGIIAGEIDDNRFSIVGFYERRARRIMPALTVVVVAVLIGTTLLYLPDDFISVPRSAIAAMLFTSNVSFFFETGYFQGGAETKPLLNTWSLGIEEQFYIGFPILLLLIAHHAPRWRTAAVAAIALASFALAVLTQDDGSGFAFYLLPPRAWELFVGALLALGAIPVVEARPRREAIAFAGLAAIVFAVTVYDRHIIFPGVTALVPVLGAAALLHCAPGTLVGRLLAARPMVAIGLISYSLYLWHWPLFVFVEYASDARLAGWTSIAAILVSLAIAGLSWRYIELPFRRPGRIGSRAIFAGSGIAIGAVCAISAAMILADGWPSRFSPEVQRIAAARHDVSPVRDRCHDSAERGRPPCRLGAKVPASALLWGDSHGVEFAFILSGIAAREGRSLIQRTQSRCPPVLGYDPPDDPGCARVNREVFAAIEADPKLHTIYLAAFWAEDRHASPETMRGLDRTIALLIKARRRVVLIGAVPPNSFDVPRRLAHLAQWGRLDQARGGDRGDLAATELRLSRVADRWKGGNFSYIDPAKAMCSERICTVIRSGKPLYFDSHHPSLHGARLILGR